MVDIFRKTYLLLTLDMLGQLFATPVGPSILRLKKSDWLVYYRQVVEAVLPLLIEKYTLHIGIKVNFLCHYSTYYLSSTITDVTVLYSLIYKILIQN